MRKRWCASALSVSRTRVASSPTSPDVAQLHPPILAIGGRCRGPKLYTSEGLEVAWKQGSRNDLNGAVHRSAFRASVPRYDQLSGEFNAGGAARRCHSSVGCVWRCLTSRWGWWWQKGHTLCPHVILDACGLTKRCSLTSGLLCARFDRSISSACSSTRAIDRSKRLSYDGRSLVTGVSMIKHLIVTAPLLAPTAVRAQRTPFDGT